MTEQQAKQQIEKAGGTWKDFLYFMRGQTVGTYQNGESNFFDCDVEQFIKNNCNKDTISFDW